MDAQLATLFVLTFAMLYAAYRAPDLGATASNLSAVVNGVEADKAASYAWRR